MYRHLLLTESITGNDGLINIDKLNLGIYNLVIKDNQIMHLLRFNWWRRKNNVKISTGRQKQIAAEAEKYLQKNFTDPSLSRKKVAAFLNISSGYLGKIFLKNAGKSLPDYWNELRISYAKELLKNTDKKITDIAFETGFNSPQHFCKTFKAQKRFTPGGFRKMKR